MVNPAEVGLLFAARDGGIVQLRLPDGTHCPYQDLMNGHRVRFAFTFDARLVLVGERLDDESGLAVLIEPMSDDE